MRQFDITVTITIPDECPEPERIDAVVLVYKSERGVEASFQLMDDTPLPPNLCAQAAIGAINGYIMAVKQTGLLDPSKGH